MAKALLPADCGGSSPRVSGRISGASFRARETVVTETPAIRAISLMVVRGHGPPPDCRRSGGGDLVFSIIPEPAAGGYWGKLPGKTGFSSPETHENLDSPAGGNDMFNHRKPETFAEKGGAAMRRTTIRDVAALAGVSPATVSRALDDRPEIRPETRERVREACRQLGYVPNAAAKGLAGQATHVLGVVVAGRVQSLLRGHRQRHRGDGGPENGYRVLLSNSLQEEERELQAIENFVARRIDGGGDLRPVPGRPRRARPSAGGECPASIWGSTTARACSYVAADNERGRLAGRPGICWTWATGTWCSWAGTRDSLTRVQRAAGFRAGPGGTGAHRPGAPRPDRRPGHAPVGLMTRRWSCSGGETAAPTPSRRFRT